MTDHTDDWMNPKMSSSWHANTKREPEPFLIQREAAVICSYVGGRRPTEWKLWSSHKTREDRDAELAKLRKQHPAWHLRPARERGLPGYQDIEAENEAADLLMQLMLEGRIKPKGRAAP